MRIEQIEKVIREGFADEELKARIINEGPVALADLLEEIEARKAAMTLTGRVDEIDGELRVQRASNRWT